ncbi:hypothetical protein PILCRDRAFT_817088 [Piloderma croceum F 1598]|uniref:ribonuclease Z n=1 Tax=Piloderma croceum (strain F 1598) TaxID=765440 RepID=A0A0C3C828_PILCF|nr:hypothetical protein PILCRDRAFT_817088 [Piloderma croceum F 1598]
MSWSANVLSTVTSDTEPTIIIEFVNAKYIFNVGENTNRAFLQNRPNWKKTKGLFLTSVGAQRASGLSGFLMTLADSSSRKVDIIGPQGLTHFIAAMRKYALRDYFLVNPIEVPINPEFSGSSAPLDPVYTDENVTIFALPIIPEDPAKQAISTTSTAVSDARLQVSSLSKLKRKRTPSPFSPSKHSDPPHTSDQDSCSSSALPAGKHKHTSIERLMKTPNFNPRVLEGAIAHQWRELVVQAMFNNTQPTPNEKSLQTASANASAGDDTITSKQGMGSSPIYMPIPRRVFHPPGFQSQLPPFSLPYRKVTNTPETKPTLAYVIVGPRVRGKFDGVKAKKLRVPNGPQRGELIKGNAVTFLVPGEPGKGMVQRTVQPEEVVGPSESPSVVLILDTPTLGHIHALSSSFTESPFFAKFRSKRPEDISDHAVRVVFHICGDGILEDERYKAFMSGFGPDVHHVVASREHDHDPITFTSAAFNQLRLSQLDPDIFRMPRFRVDAEKDLKTIPGLPLNTSLMCTNARHWIRPFQPPIYDKPSEEQDGVHSSTPVCLPELMTKRFFEARQAVEEFSKNDLATSKPGSDVVITPLGTSSACPTKYRNVSSTLIQIPKYGNVLLDTGEGTWGQFVRKFGIHSFGSSNAWEALRNLKCIFISHIHADHHLGLAKILSMRCRLNPPPEEPLYLVAHSSVFLYLHEHSDLEELGLDDPTGNGVKCILSDSLSPEGSYPQTFGDQFPWLDVPESRFLVNRLCRILGLQSFTTVDVAHSAKCHGVIMRHLDGWSIVFSGDTTPSDRLIWAGTNATLLIHEATMGDDEIEMAKCKRHCTFGQAVDVGRKMNAENILLTHFSARYPQMPPSGILTANTYGETSREPILALAFDHASIAIGDMWKMNLYLPAIEQSFRDIPDETDEIVHLEVDNL